MKTGSVRISVDPSEFDYEVIVGFLKTSYWASGIAAEKIRKAIDNSLQFGLFVNGIQAGFARVVTDYSRFAYLADVFVLEEYRGEGYGRQLIQFILDYLPLADVSRFLLATRDAHRFYETLGFKPLENPERMMGLSR